MPRGSGVRAKLFCRTGELSGADQQIGSEATIGRSAENTLVLGASVISQTHARIFFDAAAGGYILEDLQSKNGTRLDGIRIDGRERLRDLHVVTLGEEHDFIFVVLPEPANATVDDGDAVEGQGPPAPPDAASETIYDDASVLAMPALTDVPAAKGDGEEPGGQTVYESPSALQVPSFEAQPEPPGDQAVSASDTVDEPPSALQVPSFEGTAEPVDPIDPEASSGNETMLEPPSALELPPLEAGTQGTVDPEAAAAVEAAAGVASARVVLEVRVADGSCFRVELGEGRHDIGRGRDCAVWIDDRTLTRLHAVLTVTDDTVTLEDQDSRNGTFMDGARLTAPVRLRVGDVVTFGDQVTATLVERTGHAE